MELAEIRTEYSNRLPRYQKLKSEVIYILEQELEQRGIAVHLIEGRVKTIDSLLSKAEARDIQEPFETIVDICGIRIISLFMSDLEAVGDVLREKFEMETVDDKITAKGQDEFGYLSVHYVGTLPDHFSGARYDDIKNLKFEIQVRTIAMHAWATISHYLDYKSENAIPSGLRKDFSALSALFYVADSHFEMFFRSSQEAGQIAETKAKDATGIGAEEINLHTLTAFLKQKYPARLHPGPESISPLVDQLIEAQYESIADIASDLVNSEEAFVHYEMDHPPHDRKSGKYNHVGVVRVSLSIASEEYLNTWLRREDSREGYRNYRKFLHGTAPRRRSP